ncbi:MAG: hypothetical protein E5V77_24100, partial [Mesorhizobium sp.]
MGIAFENQVAAPQLPSPTAYGHNQTGTHLPERAGSLNGVIVPEQPGKNAIEVRGVRKVFGTGENQVAA